ncbi:MAG: tetratricopeptide repeat protein [Candidatus Kryptonium sp.]|nr:tetratricopeptide repeat protein [Candidatus Kryptonium sp.]MDW8109060.1 tetratricopeptide repeat protein [Candidatus Kryptonium sp.]
MRSEFNAYFNTYYNAQVIFEQVEEALQNRFAYEKFLSVEKFDSEFNIPPNDKAKLDDVIKKCSKILQYHLNTSVGDDALLMIGKSYLYQDNYLAAERKFAELISTFPKSKLYNDALYFLMLTLSKEKKYEDAIIAFQTKVPQSPRNKDLWKLYKIYGLVKYRISEIDSAIHYLNLSAQQAKGEDKAEILFYLGEISEIRNPTESAKFYNNASKATGRNNLKIYSLIKYAVQQRKIGNYELAERVLNDLIFSNIDKDYERKVYLELARTHYISGKIDLAIQTYNYLDTTYRRTEESAFGYFELGQIYETKFGKYDSAKIFYERAFIEFPQSDVAKQALKKSTILNDYFRYHDIITRNDSILKSVIHNSDSAIVINTDSLKSLISQAKYSLAWTFYMFLNRTDSAIYYLESIIDKYPESNIVPRSYYLLGTIYESIDTAKARTIYLELIRKFPHSEFSTHLMKLLGIKNEVVKDTLNEIYHKAISMIDTDPEAAIKMLTLIFNQNTNSPIKAKALYAIGWINEYKLKNFAKAKEYYTNVLEKFPGSEYAKMAELKLNPEKNLGQQPQTLPLQTLPKPIEQEKMKTKEIEEIIDEAPTTRDGKKRRIIIDDY